MPIVATVTRSSSSRFFSQQRGISVGNAGGNAYTLRKADGTALGAYRTVAEAQAIFNRFHGPNRVYRWERHDLAGDIEQHVCIGTPLNAREIWVLQAPNSFVVNSQGLTALDQWMEPNYSPNSVKLESIATNVINTISDISGNDNEMAAVEEPLLVQNDPGFNDAQSVDFDYGVAPFNGFTIPNLGQISPPYTVILMANNLNPGLNGSVWTTDQADRLRFTEVPGTGEWRLRVGASFVDSTVVGSANGDILVAKVTETETIFRVNGVEAGTIAAIPADGEVDVGGVSVDPWNGRLAFHMIADIADADNTRILQMERYLRETYQP